MNKEVYNIDRNILTRVPTSNETNLTKNPVSPVRLNLSFLHSSINKINSKKDYENSNIDTMQGFSKSSTEMLLDVNSKSLTAQKILNQDLVLNPIAPMAFSASSLGGGNFSNSINKIAGDVKSVLTDAKGSLTKFIDSVNPFKNGINGLLALVKFLMCPDSSLFDDLKNTFNKLKGIAKNINPKKLLENAIKDLGKAITEKFPVVNNMLNFFKNLEAAIKATVDLVTQSEIFQLIKETLGLFGLDFSYFNDDNILSNLSDILDPDNPIYKVLGMKLPNLLPKEAVSSKCSALGKIIDKLNSSYRSDNRFDSLNTDNRVIANIADKDLANTISGTFGVEKAASNYYNSKLTSDKLGYHGETAMNSVLSNSVEIGDHLDSMISELDKVDGDFDKFTVAKANANNSMEKINILSSVSNQRILAFDEGLKSIRRESDFFNVGKKLKKVF